jgi:hypothetical protein
LERSAADNLIVNADIDPIRPDPQTGRVQIVNGDPCRSIAVDASGNA